MWGAAVAQWGSSSSRAALCLPAPLAARCPSPALLGPATPTWPAGQPTSQPEQRLPHMPAVLCCAVLCCAVPAVQGVDLFVFNDDSSRIQEVQGE